MEISMGEMVLIGLIAFLILGPQEMVKRANQVGRWLGRMRHEVNNFKVMATDEETWLGKKQSNSEMSVSELSRDIEKRLSSSIGDKKPPKDESAT